MANYPSFSEVEPRAATKMITPLGAAIVEALSNRELVKYIKRRFKEDAECPVSELFTADQLVRFYRSEDVTITPVARLTEPPKRLAHDDRCPCLRKKAATCGDACWHYGARTVCAACDNTGNVTNATIRRNDK